MRMNRAMRMRKVLMKTSQIGQMLLNQWQQTRTSIFGWSMMISVKPWRSILRNRLSYKN